MKEIIPYVQSIDYKEEQKLAREVEGLIELYDFIQAHPDLAVKEIAKFMPPLDSRVVSKAIQTIALRDKNKKLIKQYEIHHKGFSNK